ncbi:MAG: glycosyl hydrolase [Minicystis sp.]
MIEAVMFWNEPNNKSHWDFEIDPEWSTFASMVKLASDAVRAERPDLTRVLGGISPIDAGFIKNLEGRGVIDAVDVVAVHGFPFDWNHWPIDEWPARLAEIRAVTDKPLWITEVGASSFGSEEVQELGLRRSAELARRPRPARPLVQPLRPAARLARDHAPPRGRRVGVLPPLLHGPHPRGRRAQAGARALRGF